MYEAVVNAQEDNSDDESCEHYDEDEEHSGSEHKEEKDGKILSSSWKELSNKRTKLVELDNDDEENNDFNDHANEDRRRKTIAKMYHLQFTNEKMCYRRISTWACVL